MFEKNNLAIALNILHIKEKEIFLGYISKLNSTREKQIIFLMIPNEEEKGWHYLAVKNLPTLLHGITSKYKGGFCCLNCLHSFKTENKLKSHEKLCTNKDFRGIVMPSEKDNILQLNKCMKSHKMSYNIYADIESLIKKMNRCVMIFRNFFNNKDWRTYSCGYSIPTTWAFDNTENMRNDCMKRFCTSLREQAKNLIDFEKKKMLTLTKEELRSFQDVKICYICGKRLLKTFLMI